MRPIRDLLPILSFLLLLLSSHAFTAPSPRGTHSNNKAAVPQPRSLRPRLLNHQNIRPLYFATLQFLVPVDPAIAQLETLYSTILQNALHSWSILAPRDSFVVRYNQFELAFLSSEGGVEWDFVADFAATMLARTRMGFASTFQQTWGRDGVGGAVSVILRLRGGN